MRITLHDGAEQAMIMMLKSTIISFFLAAGGMACPQETALPGLMSDSSMLHASVSLCVREAETGNVVIAFDPQRSLIPASVMKLITSGVALEMLGPGHRFTTGLYYTGSLNRKNGHLKGDIIIRGGGDPALGSEYFKDHYSDYAGSWVAQIRALGVRKIDGMIIADDSCYGSMPVPPGWLWEDIGNYYGAGVYGLSAEDNTVRIHFRTGADSTPAVMTAIEPGGYLFNYNNLLSASGSTDEGIIYSAPYGGEGWITGTIPSETDDFVLKGSMTDPPLALARMLEGKLRDAGVQATGGAVTTRTHGNSSFKGIVLISETESPSLSDIINVLNRESVNLFAETLLRELGLRFSNDGSLAAGLNVIYDYLKKAGIPAGGMHILDGSGLSPRNTITARGITDFLIYMKKEGRYFPDYYRSLPQAGLEGTLKYCFRDPAFRSLRAKSGSMTRVRCYAGYFVAGSGKDMVFSVLINNFEGPSKNIIAGIESVIREIILYH